MRSPGGDAAAFEPSAAPRQHIDEDGHCGDGEIEDRDAAGGGHREQRLAGRPASTDDVQTGATPGLLYTADAADVRTRGALGWRLRTLT